MTEKNFDKTMIDLEAARTAARVIYDKIIAARCDPRTAAEGIIYETLNILIEREGAASARELLAELTVYLDHRPS